MIPGRRPRGAIAIRPRTALMLLIATTAGLVAFCWPLLVPPAGTGIGHVADAPLVFAAVLPLLIAVTVAGLSEGGIDARTVAILGVLTGVGTVVRSLGAGTSGVELVFFLLVIAGRVFGVGFGFVLGSTTILASAMLTAGVGPWLPFQMLAASWVGAGAGLLPRTRGRSETVMLTVYGITAALLFGLLMNLWFWPFVTPDGTATSFVAGAPVMENLGRLIVFTVVTSLGWDLMRAVTTALLIVVTGPHLLRTLRRMVPTVTFGSTMRANPKPGVASWQSGSSARNGPRR